MLNSIAYAFQRSGAAAATVNGIAQGETRFIPSQGGTPTRLTFSRIFAAVCAIMSLALRCWGRVCYRLAPASYPARRVRRAARSLPKNSPFIKKWLGIKADLYTILQILSLSLFEKISLIQWLAEDDHGMKGGGAGHDKRNRARPLAADIRAEYNAVRMAVETATQHAIRCGQLLIEAKDGFVHGQWLPWLQENCALSERSAQAYMRLARKYGELDNAKAQRVADLPVRRAIKAITDERAENPTPDRGASPDRIEAWAERQVNGTFNAFDLENFKCARHKPHRQLGLPVSGSMFLARHTNKIPAPRLAPLDKIFEAMIFIAPIAKKNFNGPDIDCSGNRGVGFMAVPPLIAKRDFPSFLSFSS
ncbi:MAG: DUF3102 domain-containing protein [Rhodospirillales bacterium]|nr:DUF3102 domain-containing protein [Rhodospirillales bacterium]